jgi:lipoyl(octanoyl) transferase
MNFPIKTRWLERIPYEEGLDLQESLLREKIEGNEEDHLLLLEHNPVYTMGRSRDVSSLGLESMLPHPVHYTNRGGQATYHGPGQLVGYPILDLSRRGKDLHRYLRFLEEVVILVLAEHGVDGTRREEFTGVWVEDRKICSIGVGVRHWISMHGFSLNIARDIPGFDAITPCGIIGVSMTSLSREMNRDVETKLVAETTADIFVRQLESLKNGCF